MNFNALSQMKAKNGLGMLGDGQGLWLIKDRKERGKWVLRYVIRGKRRSMGLGVWPDVSIAEAREKASEARRSVRDDKDPIQERKRPLVAVLSLKQAIEGCFEARKAELKGDGEAGRWMSPLLVHVIPKFGTVPVEEVDQNVIKSVLDPIWHEKPEAAQKALNRIGLTLKHAAALGLSVDLQATMKARALLGKQRHETTHIPSLPYEEAPAFYKWLVGQEGVSPLALRFLILTVCRTSEVRLARFSEIDGEIWTLPSSRTKTAKEHRVPLTSEALRIVELCGGRSKEFLFPAYKGQPISDMAMSTLMKREGYVARPHGLRATFRTWVEEQTDTPFDVAESALGHAVDVGVVGAYQRSDRFEKRNALMQSWQTFLLG